MNPASYPCHSRPQDEDLVRDHVLNVDDLATFAVADAFLRSRHPDVQMFWRQVVHAGWSRYHVEALIARDDYAGFWASLGGRASILEKAMECFGDVSRLLEPLRAAGLVPFQDLTAYVESIESEMEATYRTFLPFGRDMSEDSTRGIRFLTIDVVDSMLEQQRASANELPSHLTQVVALTAANPELANAVSDPSDTALFAQTAEAYLWLLSAAGASHRSGTPA